MPEYETTGTVAAPPDELFDFLADVHHLPEYFPLVTDAQLHGDDVEVDTEIAGDHHHTHAWLHVDGLERRMEWGAKGGPYHGWLQVDPASTSGSVVTIHLFQDHESAADQELADAMENIRRLVDAGAA